jgi:hypothetical protein
MNTFRAGNTYIFRKELLVAETLRVEEVDSIEELSAELQEGLETWATWLDGKQVTSVNYLYDMYEVGFIRHESRPKPYAVAVTWCEEIAGGTDNE